MPPGQGASAVAEYIDRHSSRHAVLAAVARVGRCCQPVSYEELLDVTEIWVETALALGDSDLRRMERLAAAQERRLVRAQPH